MDNAGRYRLAANKLLYVTDQPGTFQTVPFAVMPIAGNAPVVTTGGLQKFTTGSAQLNSTVNANGHTQSICFGDSIFLGGAYRTLPGAYMDTVSTTSSCDSIITTLLTVRPLLAGIDTQSICNGDSIFLGGAYRTLPGAYMDTLSATSGCDSIITTVLTVRPLLTGIDTQSICNGDSIFLGGAYRTLPGAYMDTVSSTSGCDSIVTTVLTIRLFSAGIDTQSICFGDSIFLGGAYRTLPGAYMDTLNTTSGCDSIVTTVLTIRLFSTGIDTQFICNGDSILLGGVFRNMAGTYADTISSAQGCDSIILTTLTVNPLDTTNQSASICSGDSVFIAGAYRYVAGIYSQTFTGTTGCDSIVNTTLTVNPAPPAIITASGPTAFCAGDSVILTASNASSYIWSNGASTQSIIVFASDNYSVTVSNSNGCTAASSATTVTVNPAPDATITANGNTTFCRGGAVTLTVAQAASYLWSTNENTQSITVTTSGNYSVTVSNGNGCSAVGTVQVNSTVPPIVSLGADQNLCSCDTAVTLYSNIQGAYLWSTAATTQSISITTSGSYSVTVTDAGNCIVSDTVDIQISCLTVVATVSNPSAGSVSIGNDAALHAEPGAAGSFDYTWTPPVYLDSANVQSPHVIAPQTSTTYNVMITDPVSGCTASGSIMLTVVAKGKPVMPNAFSPNGDGLNDDYGPVIPASMQAVYAIVEMRIYDRWGVMVYNGNGYWDGTFKGAEQPAGTYMYYVTMRGPDPANPGVNADYDMTGAMTLLH